MFKGGLDHLFQPMPFLNEPRCVICLYPPRAHPEIGCEDFETAYARAVAENMIACPYRIKGDTCVTGCWEEPRCITEEPDGGWEGLL